MHYYKFNIPDWNLHTAHLTLVEDAVYRRLIDHYYDTESPIPTETQPVLRRLRLANESDIAAAILQEFFVLTDEGWRHKRCDKVIAEYHNMAAANKENGKNGGRPRKESPTKNPEETHSVTDGNPLVTLTTNQEPLTTNQEPINTSPAGESPAKPAVPHAGIIDLYNDILGSQGLALVKPALWKGGREANLRARWREADSRQTLDWWRGWFEYIAQSDFLMGRAQGSRQFRANLGWLVKFDNFAKVCEGNYHG